jgi:hypothetical protein
MEKYVISKLRNEFNFWKKKLLKDSPIQPPFCKGQFCESLKFGNREKSWEKKSSVQKPYSKNFQLPLWERIRSWLALIFGKDLVKGSPTFINVEEGTPPPQISL